MSDTVENRVVEMEFDNKDFEKNVAVSLNTLDKLKEALQFSNASKGFTEIQNSIRNLDFSPIENSLHSLENGFMTLLGSLKRNFFDQISNSILNMGTQLYQNTLGQIKSGGQRRAMNIEQAKFKIKGLDQDWETVYKDMDYAVSGTAYGIDQAANAASQFLASGVTTGDDMKAALRGISGIAAMTSADYDEIANIFTAAAGKGKVQAMELNRISQRGVNAAAAIAKQLNTTEEAVRDMASKGEIDFNTFAKAMDDAFGEHAKKANETFTGSLSNMKAALSRIGEIFYAPYLENMIPVFNRLREVIDKFKNAMKEPMNDNKESVATKISDLYKKVSELFLAWTQTWEPRLEKLPSKMEKWFIALDYIGKKVDKFKSVLEDVSKGVASITKSASADLSKLTAQEEQAARDIWIIGNWGNGEERKKNLEAAGMSYERVQTVVNQIVEGSYKWDKWLYKAAGVAADTADAYTIHSWAVNAILESYQTLRMIMDTVEASMQKLFKIFRAAYRGYLTAWSSLTGLTKDVGSPIQELIQLVRVFIRNFQIAGDRTKGIKSTFKGLFSIIKLGSYILASFFKALQGPIRELAKGDAVITKFSGTLGDKVYDWVKAIIESGKIEDAMKNMADTVSKVIKKIQEIGSGKASISDIFKSIIDKIKSVISTIKKLITGETTFGDVFKSISEKIKNFIKGLNGTAEEIESPLGKIFNNIKTFVTNILTLIGHNLFGSDFSFADWFKKVFSKEDTEGETKDSKGIIPTLSEKITELGDQMGKLWTNVKKFLSNIWNGITAIWNMIKDEVEALGNMFTSIFKYVGRMFDLGSQNADGMAQNFQAFADFVSTCFIVAREVVWSIKDPLKDIAKAVADMIAGIANMFAGITNWVGNDPEQAYGAAAFFGLLKVIEKIMDYKILQKKGSKDSVLYSIATFFDDMRSAVDMWRKEHLERVIETIAKSLLMVAIGVALLVAVMSGAAIGTSSKAAQDAALQSFLYLSAFMWEMFAIMVITKKIFAGNTLDFTFLTIIFQSLSSAMLMISIGMAMVIAASKDVDMDHMDIIMVSMFFILAELVGGIVLLVYLTEKWTIDEKKLAAVATFMTAFAMAIKSLMRGISVMMGIIVAMVKAQGGDTNAWDNACQALMLTVAAAGVLMLALGGAFAIMFTTGKNMPDAKNLVALAVMLIVFTGCIKSIMLSMVMLIGVMEISDADTVFSALGFVTVFSLVLAAMLAVVIFMLSKVTNPDSLTKNLLAIAGVILVIGNCIQSIALAASAMAIAGVTSSQMESVVLIVGIISALVIALAAIGIIGGASAGTGLVAFAAGILMIAMSIYFINKAILAICEAITLLITTFVALAAVWPQVSGKVPKMLDDLEVQLPRFITLVGNCIIQLANLIIEAAPLIGEAIALIIATVIQVSWGYIPKVVASFLGMLDSVLDLLLDGCETILPKALLILLMLIAYLDANAVALGYLLADVLMKVIWGALMAIGDFLKDTVFPWLVRKLGDIFADGRQSLIDTISDAALGGPVEKDDRIVLRETAEVNSVTKTHFKYYNPLTDQYYDTLEEAENAELDEALAKNKEKSDKALELQNETINRNVELNTEYSEKAKGLGSFKDSDAYKELSDTTGVKESIGSFVGDIKAKASEKFGLATDEATKGAKEDAMANGEEIGEALATGELEGAKSGAEALTKYLPNMETPAFETPDTEELMKQYSNMDISTQLPEYNGTYAIKTETDDEYANLNQLTDGSMSVKMDSTDYANVVQQNTDSTKEQISMLDKVKNALDSLKENLKDCIIVPQGANFDVTTTIDKQVLGKTMTPVVNAINQSKSSARKRNLAGES